MPTSNTSSALCSEVESPCSLRVSSVAMVVCHCEAINDGTVRAAIEGGATDVETVTARCGAGRDCGGCHETIEAMLEQRVRRPVRRAAAAA